MTSPCLLSQSFVACKLEAHKQSSQLPCLISDFVSPVPVQFDWDKIRTEMKPIKMARTKAKHAQKKSPKKKIRSNWRYFGLKFEILLIFRVYFPRLFTFSVKAESVSCL